MGKRGNAVGEDGMAGLEVKSVNLLGTPVSYAYAVKAGPWIFLTGHEAFDFAGGTPEAVAGPAGFPLFGRPRSRREGDFILQRMRRILQEFGADLSNGVRLDQVYPNPAAVAAYHLARHAEFGDYIPPSTSVVMERCFAADTTISTSLIAVAAEAGYEIRKVYPPGVASAPTSGFVPAVVCDDFVFVAGQMAHNPGEGLDPRAHVPEHSAWAGSEIRKQSEFLISEKLKPALEAAGSSLEQSVKAQVYLARVEDFPDFIDVWNRHYQNIPCAVTVVPTKSFATVGGIIEINLIALTNTARRKKEVITADIPGMAAYGPCLRVGEFLLPSGLMAVGHDGHVVGNRVSPGLRRTVICRVQPGRRGLRLCRGAVPGGRHRDGEHIARAVFRAGCQCVPRHRDGLGPALRRPAAPVLLHPDAAGDARTGRHADCRFLDFDGSINPSSR
jgi:enamine deaminase RidA (YjgF/YER057c/UK114 family)